MYLIGQVTEVKLGLYMYNSIVYMSLVFKCIFYYLVTEFCSSA